MRKVTERAALALKNRTYYKSGNTEVRQFTHDTAFWGLFLHGNCIAMYGLGELTLKDADWQTATTKERLNGLLDTFDINYRVGSLKGNWYIQEKGTTNNRTWNGVETFKAAH